MAFEVDVTFTPAEFAQLPRRDLAQTTCVVFDVLRATSVFVTALANGAAAIIPVESVAAALEARGRHPAALLAGERNGLRLTAAQAGGTDFDLGNSPREFTPEKIAGRTIISTTTNGTRAIRACHGAATVLAGAWLNLRATFEHWRRHPTDKLLLVCSGTGEDLALEDCLAAGHFCERLRQTDSRHEFSDSAQVAWRLYREASADLRAAVCSARNASRLLAIPDLKADVDFCLQPDRFAVVAAADSRGMLRLVLSPSQTP